MSRKRLFDDFEPTSKAQWLEMVSNDARSVTLLDKLNWQVGDINMPAYTTREDLKTVNETQSNTHWTYPNGWQIAEVCGPDTTPDEFQRALQEGADVIWLESDRILKTDFSSVDLSPHLFHFSGAAFHGDKGIAQVKHLADPPGSISILNEDVSSVTPALLQVVQTTNNGRTISIQLKGRQTDESSDLSDALHAFLYYATSFIEAGVSLTAFLELVQFIFPLSPSFYLEIARVRALRLLLSKLILALDPTFCGTVSIPFIADVPSLSNIENNAEKEDAHSDILRGTTMAMAAALSGCHLVIVRPFSTDNDGQLAVRIARNTQLMLKHEAHLDHVIDPGAGSYYIDILTHQLASAAWDRFSTVRNEAA